MATIHTNSPPTPRLRRTEKLTWGSFSRLIFKFRRILVVALIAGLILFAVEALQPKASPTEPVAIARVALSSDHKITESDIKLTQVPTELVPHGTYHDVASIVDLRTIHPVPRGAIVTDSAVLGPDTGYQGPPGTVIIPVRFSESVSASLVPQGSRVNVLASSEYGTEQEAPARVVAENAFVVAPAPSLVSGELLGSPSGDNAPVLLAVTPTEATLIAGAMSQAVFALVILPSEYPDTSPP